MEKMGKLVLVLIRLLSLSRLRPRFMLHWQIRWCMACGRRIWALLVEALGVFILTRVDNTPTGGAFVELLMDARISESPGRTEIGSHLRGCEASSYKYETSDNTAELHF
jgi:hypothetical protein